MSQPYYAKITRGSQWFNGVNRSLIGVFAPSIHPKFIFGVCYSNLENDSTGRWEGVATGRGGSSYSHPSQYDYRS